MPFDPEALSKLKQMYEAAINDYRSQEARTHSLVSSIITPPGSAALAELLQQDEVEAVARAEMIEVRKQFLDYLRKYVNTEAPPRP